MAKTCPTGILKRSLMYYANVSKLAINALKQKKYAEQKLNKYNIDPDKFWNNLEVERFDLIHRSFLGLLKDTEITLEDQSDEHWLEDMGVLFFK